MSLSILIADDEHHIRLLIQQALEELEDDGVEILTASDGQEALDVARQIRPAVMLLDVMMPKVNGFDVCQQLKTDLAADAPQIVLLTAKGQAFDRERGAQAGADRYMTKPFDPDELLRTVREALR